VSFKPIDLQTSMPRSAEISPIQQIQQQRPAMEQEILGREAEKLRQKQARSNVKTEASSQRTVSEREPRQPGQRPRPRPKPKQPDRPEEQREAPLHPYKGKHIDFTL